MTTPSAVDFFEADTQSLNSTKIAHMQASIDSARNQHRSSVSSSSTSSKRRRNQSLRKLLDEVKSTTTTMQVHDLKP